VIGAGFDKDRLQPVLDLAFWLGIPRKCYFYEGNRVF
jgi:hypothetical protein